MTVRTPARAQLGRYGFWHLRDYLRDKGIATLLTLALLGYLTQVPIMRARAEGLGGELLTRIADEAFISALRFLGFVGVLFATNGMISDDRKYAYYRLLFAKPVSVVAYYAQKWAIYGVGFVAVTAVLLALYAATVEPVLPPLYVPAFALVYLALGGVGFLLSAAWRFDWLSLAVVVGVSDALWQLFRDDGGLTGALLHLLPPVHLLDGVYRAVRLGAELALGDVLWLAGYGAAAFALGLVVVRRRSLGS